MPHLPLYAALGVPPTATDDELKRAWKAAAREHHPDRNPDDAVAAARFREVRAAWEVLRDPERRIAYDRFGEDATSVFFDAKRAAAAEQAAAKRARHTVSRTSETRHDPGHRPRSRYTVTQGEDLRASLHLTASEALRGGHFELVLEPSRTCEACGGTGWRVGGRACSKCEGGVVVGLGPWKVIVPSGVQDGQRLQVVGEGRKGRGHGAGPGDLWITCRVRASFERTGDATRIVVPLDPDQLAEGGWVRVPTPAGGAVRVRVRPKTRPGQGLRLKGKGMVGSDLIVVLAARPEPTQVQAMRVAVGGRSGH